MYGCIFYPLSVFLVLRRVVLEQYKKKRKCVTMEDFTYIQIISFEYVFLMD